MARYAFALAERLGQDVDDVLAWPFDKLQRWMAYDEISFMIQSVRKGHDDMPESDAVAIVRDEQARNDWRGVYKVIDNA